MLHLHPRGVGVCQLARQRLGAIGWEPAPTQPRLPPIHPPPPPPHHTPPPTHPPPRPPPAPAPRPASTCTSRCPSAPRSNIHVSSRRRAGAIRPTLTAT